MCLNYTTERSDRLLPPISCYDDNTRARGTADISYANVSFVQLITALVPSGVHLQGGRKVKRLGWCHSSGEALCVRMLKSCLGIKLSFSLLLLRRERGTFFF